jgi:gliding motility-associated-like protein
VAVCVKEYDKDSGNLLSINRRDFQFNVVECEKEVEADFSSPTSTIANGNIMKVCGPATVDFNNLSTGADNYYWSFGDPTTTNDNSNSANPDYAYPDTGDYEVTLVATTNAGCTDTTSTMVHILPGVNSGFNYSTTCQDTPVPFTNTSFADSSTIQHYSWDFDDGTFSTDTHPEHQFARPDSYDVELIAEDNNGCLDTTTQLVPFYPAPEIQSPVSQYEGCEPLAMNFEHQSNATSEYEYRWKFGDGVTSDAPNPEHVYRQPGSYQVSLIITSPTGCETTETSDGEILVKETPVSEFTMSERNTTYLEPEIKFQETSVAADQWRWYFDEEDTSHLPAPTHTFQDTGHRPITLVSINDNGCRDTVIEKVFIKPDVVIYFPNAFTPDQDGHTDDFGAVGKFKGVMEYEMQIWSRWGELIYKTNKVTGRWNGRKNNNGPPAPIGTYIYRARLVDYFGQKYKYEGTVTLLR